MKRGGGGGVSVIVTSYDETTWVEKLESDLVTVPDSRSDPTVARSISTCGRFKFPVHDLTRRIAAGESAAAGERGPCSTTDPCATSKRTPAAGANVIPFLGVLSGILRVVSTGVMLCLRAVELLSCVV